MRRSHSPKGNKPTFDAAVAGAHLRLERERHGLTQRDVAAKAGVSQKTVANIERAIGDASLKNIEAVALALDKDLIEIIQLSRRSAA
jgi:transcriptional regulator with XRE-family HTH domain